MTKKLTELFDLPPPDATSDEVDIDAEPDELSQPLVDISEATTDALDTLEKIERALPQVRGLEASDIELDNIADIAINSYRDLVDLGMQVDSRFSSEIFAVGATMLGHALTAKTAKINKKLKMIDLQLKKAALDQKSANVNAQVQATPLGQGRALDRNEILRMFSDKQPPPQK